MSLVLKPTKRRHVWKVAQQTLLKFETTIRATTSLANASYATNSSLFLSSVAPAALSVQHSAQYISSCACPHATPLCLLSISTCHSVPLRPFASTRLQLPADLPVDQPVCSGSLLFEARHATDWQALHSVGAQSQPLPPSLFLNSFLSFGLRPNTIWHLLLINVS